MAMGYAALDVSTIMVRRIVQTADHLKSIPVISSGKIESRTSRSSFCSSKPMTGDFLPIRLLCGIIHGKCEEGYRSIIFKEIGMRCATTTTQLRQTLRELIAFCGVITY